MTSLRFVLAPVFVFLACAQVSADEIFTFASIDGGDLSLEEHEGPVLVVNTASLCGFTPQYEGLQNLHETFSEEGLMVVAVPSDDFRQELDDESAVKEFCEITYGLTLPMTEITPVTGDGAHTFYQWVRQQTGWEPRWNFNKVLVADGKVVGTYGARVKPESPKLRRAIAAALD
ncbi:glutathione peroxidase [Palleronia caenipelagi]|uniref:glutathione peroxidase n=1 Tax=Palleronia caenipelagi TaxID=2489174 RepID=UPI001FECB17D|nr:glutathione peroxidase [Palleronia caenipelagi]